MTEDPVLRRIHNALADALGIDRPETVASEYITPRAGTAMPSDELDIWVNDVLITEPTPFEKGARVRMEGKGTLQ